MANHTAANKRSAARTLPSLPPAPHVAAPDDKCFWVNHGPVLRDLNELRHALQTMSAAQFAHHVNEQRNDFATWVADVLEAPQCATALRCATAAAAAYEIVDDYLRPASRKRAAAAGSRRSKRG